jgi:hypothetical protein
MTTKTLPLREMSIDDLYNGDKATYEVPIYQRNFAWEKDEIAALIQDVYDAFEAKKPTYFIGTLVSFHKGDQVYEVIDGQQRLTTIYLALVALGVTPQNRLTYRARKKSNDTIQSLPNCEIDEVDYGIVQGYKFTKDAIGEIVPKPVLKSSPDGFETYFRTNVHLVHYQVPKDIDLNRYFEIMNSRGEQLEKHEIIKARLIEKLNNDDKSKFNRLWENCYEMNTYIQQKYVASDRQTKQQQKSESDQKSAAKIFDKSLCDFVEFKASGDIMDFDSLPAVRPDSDEKPSIRKLIDNKDADERYDDDDKIDTFQPIIDFSNFLLIVLKLTRMGDSGFDPKSFSLDDKELLREFDKVQVSEDFVKKFGFNLLKAKYLLDNYIVHHSNEDDTIDSNPWKLQRWQQGEGKNRYLKNLSDKSDEIDEQRKIIQLLSMFEVSFSARQRKNYLFYCLMYLLNDSNRDINNYCAFLSGLAEKYFKDVYLMADNLNEINTPKPGSFDGAVLKGNALDIEPLNENCKDCDFVSIYGDGSEKSKGVPLFVFNYLDFKLWKKYADELRSKKGNKDSKDNKDRREKFFSSLGCEDFGLEVFNRFYFSRTRRSLEHYFPQANANGQDGAPTEEQINCFGNYAMIGTEANSSGSNWTPKTKHVHYLDASGKIKLVSVASLKFMVMMQMCKDNQESSDGKGLEWSYKEIKKHQEKMLDIFGIK